MRNLKEYPITHEEMMTFLDELAKEYDPAKTGLVGDIRPIIIHELMDIIPIWELVKLTEGGNIPNELVEQKEET